MKTKQKFKLLSSWNLNAKQTHDDIVWISFGIKNNNNNIPLTNKREREKFESILKLISGLQLVFRIEPTSKLYTNNYNEIRTVFNI